MKLLLICVSISFIIGFFLGKTQFKNHTEIKYLSNVQESTIKPEGYYKKISPEIKEQLFKCYTEAYPNIYLSEQNNYYTIHVDFCERNFQRDVTGFNVTEKGNWKLNLTLAGIGLITGGIITYKLCKKG